MLVRDLPALGRAFVASSLGEGKFLFITDVKYIDLGEFMSIFKKLKKFYQASAENRTQIRIFLGFVIVPLIGMSLLYIYVRIFWL